MKLTQKNFDKLVETLNHRITDIESDLKWMKRLGYYMATILTAIALRMVL